MKKQTQLIETQYVDNNTGEILSTQTLKTYKIPNEPDYIKLYISDLMRLQDMPNNTNDFFYTLLKTMDYNNRVYLTKSIRDTILNSMGISKRTLQRMVENCIKNNLMTKLDAQTYVLNPNIFGRGSWKDIKEIRMMISYNKEGKMILNYDEYKKRIDIPKEQIDQPKLF